MLVKTISEGDNKNEADSIIAWKGLPHYSGVFLNEETYVSGGFENKLTLFKRRGNSGIYSGVTFEFLKYMTGNLLDSATSVDKKTIVGNMKNIFERSGLNNLEKKTVDMKDSAMAHTNPPKVRRFGNQVCSYDSNGSVLFWNAE